MPTLVFSSKDENRRRIRTYTPDQKSRIESMKFFDALCRDSSLRRKVKALVQSRKREKQFQV